MSFIKRILWSFRARSCPGIRIGNAGSEIEFIKSLKFRDGLLVESWDAKGWEIAPDKDGNLPRPITIIQNGKKEMGYVVHPSGVVVELKDMVVAHPPELDSEGKLTGKIDLKSNNIGVCWEGIIGRIVGVNLIGEAANWARSGKDRAIDVLIGVVIGAWFFAPMIQGMLS